MDMNWQKGLLRLWMLTSVLWALGTATVTAFRIEADIRGNYEYAQRVSIENGAFVPIPPRTAKVAPDFFLSPDVSKTKEHEPFQSFSDGSWLYIHRTHSSEDKAFLAKAFWDQRWSRWLNIVGYWPPVIMVAAPIAVLLLGYAFNWAFAGFRINGARR